jgi:RNA polymerase sigma factor (sigma-70 family)
MAAKFCPQSNGVDFDDFVSDGMLCLSRAVAKFDRTRGYRLSTAFWRYATRDLAKLKESLQPHVSTKLTGTPLDGTASFEFRAATWTRPDHHDDIEQADARLDIEDLTRRAELTESEWVVIQVRFFEGGTLDEAGAAIGCTKERARQVQLEALAKLRAAMILDV